MSGRLAVLVGLLAGLLTAGIALVVAAGYAPRIADALYPTPVVPGVTAPPTLPPRPTGSAVTATPPAGSGDSPASSPATSAGASPSRPPSPSASAGGGAAFRIGEPAPPLALPLLGGGEIDLAQLRGLPVWVTFMATWCEPCRDEFPQMSVFQARYEDEGLIVLAVDVREEAAVVQAFVDLTGAIFRVALDIDGVAQRAWGAAALPIHFWVDRAGIIRDGAVGAISPEDMARGIGTIMPEIQVTPP